MTVNELTEFRRFHAMEDYLPDLMESGKLRKCNAYMYETHVVDKIITAATAAGLLVCKDPSHCWKMNVIEELNAQYYDSGLSISTYPWTGSTTWPQVAEAAELLCVDICAGLDGNNRTVIDRMELHNLKRMRTMQEEKRAKVSREVLEWDEKYADVFESAPMVTAKEKDLKLRATNTVDLTSDCEE